MSAATIEVTHDCPATIVPFGVGVTLAAGERVRVMQRLGGSITVQTDQGSLLRIDAADADAIGLDPEAGDAPPEAPVSVGAGTAPSTGGPFEMDRVTEALRTVYDPEIPVNIVDLGLVYRCEEHPRPDGGRRIEIDMSMTAPGCGMGDILRADAAQAVQAVPGVDEVDVDLVWDPPWSMHRMSEETRLELGLL
jgi:probable FeS assembly SUF system protein SufT